MSKQQPHWKPPGFGTLTPHITIKDCGRAMEFYTKALGTSIESQHHGPDGSVMHGNLKIGDSMLMVNEEVPARGGRDPFGHVWSLAARQEDLSPGQISQRLAAAIDASGNC